jgi:hypothetical protein
MRLAAANTFDVGEIRLCTNVPFLRVPQSPGMCAGIRISQRTKTNYISDTYIVAEREGFEPPIRLPVCRISSAVHSTTLPPLQVYEIATQSAFGLIVERAGCYPFAFSRACVLRRPDHGQRARRRLPAFPA